MPFSESELRAAAQRILATPADGPAATIDLTPEQVAAMIDHTLLKPQANDDQVRELCNEALECGFAAVCVNPTWVPLCSSLLEGSPVRVATVIGFPLGATLAGAKADEAARSMAAGATELDMVINIGALKSRMYDVVQDDIAGVVKVAHQAGGARTEAGAGDGAIVKVIIETAYLTDEEKVEACLLARAAGADFVKTSTGFGPAGATVADVLLMRRAVGPGPGVKAAGGVRTAAEALAMIAAGANRIGSSSGVKIVGELMEKQ